MQYWGVHKREYTVKQFLQRTSDTYSKARACLYKKSRLRLSNKFQGEQYRQLLPWRKTGKCKFPKESYKVLSKLV